MATYQLVFTRVTGDQTSNLADFPDDFTAVKDTMNVLSDEVTSIAIGCGSMPDVNWLGVWDYDDGTPLWVPVE